MKTNINFKGSHQITRIPLYDFQKNATGNLGEENELMFIEQITIKQEI